MLTLKWWMRAAVSVLESPGRSPLAAVAQPRDALGRPRSARTEGLKRLLAAGSLASLLSCCVARGARVRVPGGTRPIEELKIGDEVISIDPQTGEQVAAPLAAVRAARRECVRLVSNRVELTLTSDHPIYCPRAQQWAPAGDWVLGTRTQLLEALPGALRLVRVTEVLTYCGVHEVFDLTVDHTLHNFVANGVLVHNKLPPSRWCVLPDGGSLRENWDCICPDGSIGRLTCLDVTQPYCQLCFDGGTDCRSCSTTITPPP